MAPLHYRILIESAQCSNELGRLITVKINQVSSLIGKYIRYFPA
jgi:hypothetical protein